MTPEQKAAADKAAADKAAADKAAADKAAADKAAENTGLTAEQAAKLVKREVLELAEKEGDKPKVKKVDIKPDEVFSFKDYGDHVVVVTTDGQKFTGDKK